MSQRESNESILATVLLCTYNRASMLEGALESLRRVESAPGCRWELLVIDNNSSDDTRTITARAARTFPVPLRYEFEPRQGKSFALNRGISSARGSLIVFGDDDQLFDPQWVREACGPMLADPEVAYTGGPVLPLWDARAPRWLDTRIAELKAPLGLFDYGPERFRFEARGVVPGGGNMAVRRALFDRIGGFRTELGRRGRSLLGQEQAEFFHRTRAVGARGVYVPNMRVHHRIPPGRLTRSYYRRWWYWKGVAQSRFHSMHQRTELGLDLSGVPHVASVPRFIFGHAARESVSWLRNALARQPMHFVHELRVMYALGYIADRQRGPVPPAAASPRPVLQDTIA
jgi:glycosyltransferase involved in cell wall biosynthesis